MRGADRRWPTTLRRLLSRGDVPARDDVGVLEARMEAIEAAQGRLAQDVAATWAEAAADRAATLAAIGALRDELRRCTERDLDHVRRIAGTAAAIADHLAAADDHASPIGDGPLVSIVLPVRDRPAALRRALASVTAQSYPRWECVVVDDGSAEPAQHVVDELGDPRIVVVRTGPDGVAAARNAGIARATGSLVTFLDSDNEWFPSRLARLVDAMHAAPDAGWAVDGQLVDDTGGGLPFVRDLRWPLDTLRTGNFIDLGSLCIRRPLLDRVGRFDVDLPRFGDWDLVARLAAVEPPLRLATIGFRYHDSGRDRITSREAGGPSAHRIRRRAVGAPASGLRVLFAEWHYPQVTESYVEADLQGLRSIGAHVEVWSEREVATAFEPTVAVHRGDLADAIAGVRPDVVVTHWSHIARDVAQVVADAGVPHVVRGHGFDFDAGVVAELLRRPSVLVHLFPHQAGAWAEHPRVVAVPVAFDTARFLPRAEKDRTLVVRTVAGLRTKDVEVFVETAARCPDHRFVLAVARALEVEHVTDEIVALARGSRVEVLVDVAYPDVAELVSSAGIYLHTHGESHPLGMPVSIAEAMATGAYLVGRDLPGMRAYLDRAGDLYRGATVAERADHAAALVEATRWWDEDRWASAWRSSVDVAWTHHPNDLVAAAMVESWRERLGVGRR